VGVVYVSHRLEELPVIADRVTVLRDGVVAGRGAIKDFRNGDLAELIVGSGRQVERAPSNGHRALAGDTKLAFHGVTTNELRDATFSVHGGEIVGLAGLAGSGFEDVVRVLHQRTPVRAGRIEAAGVPITGSPPHELARRGLAVLPSERILKMLPSMTVRENATLPSIRRFWRGGRLRLREERAAADEIVKEYQVQPARREARIEELSGGNQQKVNIARWLRTDPELLVLAEPTQGVDIGGKGDILDLLRGAAARGAGVLICSSDVYELEAVCTRVLVLREGRVAAELSGSRLIAQQISHKCYGLEEEK
jgi:ribose transport system ATP-binding protein